MDKVRSRSDREGGLGHVRGTSPGMDEVDNVWNTLSRALPGTSAESNAGAVTETILIEF